MAGGGFYWPLAAPSRSLLRDRLWLLSLPVTAVALACSPGWSLWPIAVPRSLSPFSWPLAITEAVASLFCPLAVWGERLASQAWDAWGCGDGCCRPASRCLWSVTAVTPLSVGSAVSPFLPVVTGSGHRVGYLRLLLHPERGFGCALLLSMENQPLGAASTASSGVCASLSLPCPVRQAGDRDRTCVPLDLVVRCSSACGAEFRVLASSVGPLFALLSGNWNPLVLPRIFRGGLRGTSSSHCWSLLNWRHLKCVPARFCRWPLPLWPSGCRLRSSATAAGSRAGMDSHLSSPSFGSGELRQLLYPWCLVHWPEFISSQSWPLLDFHLRGGFGGLVQVFSCLTLSVPVGVVSDFSPVDFSSLWLCLVERI